jgi:hypothetical protein
MLSISHIFFFLISFPFPKTVSESMAIVWREEDEKVHHLCHGEDKLASSCLHVTCPAYLGVACLAGIQAWSLWLVYLSFLAWFGEDPVVLCMFITLTWATTTDYHTLYSQEKNFVCVCVCVLLVGTQSCSDCLKLKGCLYTLGWCYEQSLLWD